VHLQHARGRCVWEQGQFHYQYNLTDHLGNVRVVFGDGDHDGRINPDPVAGLDVVQVVRGYYPFGARHGSDLSTVAPPENQYLYNGKELQDELNLGWYDYGARMYDPTVGRWNGVDALAEKYTGMSPYNYTLNNPIIFVDPDGRMVSFARNSFELSYPKPELLLDRLAKNDMLSSPTLAKSNSDYSITVNAYWQEFWSGISPDPAKISDGPGDPPNAPKNPKDGDSYTYKGKTYYATGGHWSTVKSTDILGRISRVAGYIINKSGNFVANYGGNMLEATTRVGSNIATFFYYTASDFSGARKQINSGYSVRIPYKYKIDFRYNLIHNGNLQFSFQKVGDWGHNIPTRQEAANTIDGAISIGSMGYYIKPVTPARGVMDFVKNRITNFVVKVPVSAASKETANAILDSE
ncbi:MAG: RHS repeat-associated core domain-containing protein, partial [Bacteroidota bacterium]